MSTEFDPQINPESGICRACGERIPYPDWERHAAGLDRHRLTCPHQDVSALAEEQRARDRRWRGYGIW